MHNYVFLYYSCYNKRKPQAGVTTLFLCFMKILLLESELCCWDVITVCETCEGLLACGGNGPERKERHAQEKVFYVCCGILTFQEAALWKDKRL